jgi:hypothetical protein
VETLREREEKKVIGESLMSLARPMLEMDGRRINGALDVALLRERKRKKERSL